MSRLVTLRRALNVERVQPSWRGGVPLCTESCQSHDGKRCERLGYQPGPLCEPTVRAMAKALAGER